MTTFAEGTSDKGFKLNKGLIIFLSIAAGLLIFSCSGYGYVNSTRNTSIELQNGLVARYSDAQNELAKHTTAIVERAHVTSAKKDALAEIIKGAMQGRYGDKGFGQGSMLFGMVKEADLGLAQNMQIYDDLAREVSAGREAYKNKQSALIDFGTAAKNWYEEGIIRSHLVKAIGYPDETLTAKDGNTVLTGMPALKFMIKPILNEATNTAYQTGKAEALDPFKK